MVPRAPNGPGPVARREASDSETRKEFIPVRRTLGRQWTSVSKTVSEILKIVQVDRKNVGQRSEDTGRRP